MQSNRSLLPIIGLGLLFSLGVSAKALAELTVIYDNGQTRPLAPLLEPLLADDSPSSGPAVSTTLNPSSSLLSSDGPADLRNLLPVRSPGLTVGDIAGSALRPEVLTRLAQGNPRPFFLIGSDAMSLRWLASHRDVLRKPLVRGGHVDTSRVRDGCATGRGGGARLVYHPGIRD
jgi:hypothetical protein